MINRVAQKRGKSTRWAVTVRLADGSTRYYAARSERQGQQEWTPRENQAHAFAMKEDAAGFAASCETNADAKEYVVVLVRT